MDDEYEERVLENYANKLDDYELYADENVMAEYQFRYRETIKKNKLEGVSYKKTNTKRASKKHFTMTKKQKEWWQQCGDRNAHHKASECGGPQDVLKWNQFGHEQASLFRSEHWNPQVCGLPLVRGWHVQWGRGQWQMDHNRKRRRGSQDGHLLIATNLHLYE